jgi:probable F420-dependent oxidoreductase
MNPTGITNGVAMMARGAQSQIEYAQTVERLGYDTIWVSEVNGYDAVSVMTAVAGATSRVTIASGIVGIYLRDPLLMAMGAAAVNEFADGRLVLGLGTSTPVIVEQWHGMTFDRPLARMREYVGLVKRLMAGERVKHAGAYTLRGAQLGAPSRGPVPVFLAALNPKMLELSGEIAEGVILNFPSLDYTRQAIALIETGLRRAGKDRSEFNITVFMRTSVTDNPAAVLPKFRSELLTYVLAPVYRRIFTADGYGDMCDQVNDLWAKGDREGALAAVNDEFVLSRSVIGTADECRQQYQAYRARGVDAMTVFPVPEEDGADVDAGRLRIISALAPQPVPATRA